MKKVKTKAAKHGSRFKYKVREPETIKRRSEQTGGRFDSPYKQNFDVWRPKAGDNNIRILPPTWDEAEHFGLDVWLHRWIGADNSNYLCLQKMKNKPCPVCVAAKAAIDAGEADEGKALQAARVVLVWILDRDEDDNNPMLYPMSWTIDRDIAALCHNKKTGKVLLIDHPDEGYDLSFRRTGEGLKTRYGAFQIDRDPSPISEDSKAQDAVIDFITENPLPSVLAYRDAKYLEGVLAGQTEAKDEDLDEDEEDEDETDTTEDDETEDDEGDDDEEEAPRGKRAVKGKSSRKADDDEDDEEDDDDEEEDSDTEEDDDDDGEEEEEDEPEDEEDEEEEEEERPRAKAKASKKPVAKKRPIRRRR